MSGIEDETEGLTRSFLVRLGEQVRAARRAKGFTVKQLAERSGVSRRMLTQIELGQANPSMVTVDKVARALGTDFASLARTDTGGSLTLSAPGAAPVIWETPLGSRAVLQSAGTRRDSPELWEWLIAPGDRYQAHADPPGHEELYWVASGSLTIAAEGAAPVVLNAGGSARFASDRSYRFENHGEVPVHFVLVWSPDPQQPPSDFVRVSGLG